VCPIKHTCRAGLRHRATRQWPRAPYFHGSCAKQSKESVVHFVHTCWAENGCLFQAEATIWLSVHPDTSSDIELLEYAGKFQAYFPTDIEEPFEGFMLMRRHVAAIHGSNEQGEYCSSGFAVFSHLNRDINYLLYFTFEDDLIQFITLSSFPQKQFHLPPVCNVSVQMYPYR